MHDLYFFKEVGIFDALEKQYLRSFIFAVYLVRGILEIFAPIQTKILTPFQDEADPEKCL